MKINSYAASLRLTHEVITKVVPLSDFDMSVIQHLQSICKKIIPDVDVDASNNTVAKAAVSGASMSSISVRMLITAVNADKNYVSIARTISPHIISYSSVLVTFKIEQEAYLSVKDKVDPKFPKINGRDKNRKIICWSPIFKDFLTSSRVSRGPLNCVLREDAAAPDETVDPLFTNCYHRESRRFISELESRLPHEVSICNNDNNTGYAKIEESARGLSVE